MIDVEVAFDDTSFNSIHKTAKASAKAEKFRIIHLLLQVNKLHKKGFSRTKNILIIQFNFTDSTWLEAYSVESKQENKEYNTGYNNQDNCILWTKPKNF